MRDNTIGIWTDKIVAEYPSIEELEDYRKSKYHHDTTRTMLYSKYEPHSKNPNSRWEWIEGFFRVRGYIYVIVGDGLKEAKRVGLNHYLNYKGDKII